MTYVDLTVGVVTPVDTENKKLTNVAIHNQTKHSNGTITNVCNSMKNLHSDQYYHAHVVQHKH